MALKYFTNIYYKGPLYNLLLFNHYVSLLLLMLTLTKRPHATSAWLCILYFNLDPLLHVFKVYDVQSSELCTHIGSSHLDLSLRFFYNLILLTRYHLHWKNQLKHNIINLTYSAYLLLIPIVLLLRYGQNLNFIPSLNERYGKYYVHSNLP